MKLLFAASVPLLADEAYYWVWAQRPAWGYYDQPPMIAWWIALFTQGSDSALAVRLPALLAGLAPLALWRWAGDKERWVFFGLGVPPLLWLTLFSTADAPLLAGWSLAMAGALAGGRGWWLAGVAAALASLGKYTGLAVFPLLVLAAGPGQWRSPHPWIGASLWIGLLLPHLRWLAAHDWVSLRFPLSEGWLSPAAPGPAGVLVQLGDTALVAGPLTALLGLLWLAAPRRFTPDLDARVLRSAWLTSAPIFAFFAVSAVGGPPEAHWTAPAWIGLGLGLSHLRGRMAKILDLSLWLGVLASAALMLHAHHPLLRLPRAVDPATRLGEGRSVSEQAALWALPDAAGGEVAAIWTERYQEAALITWERGLPARVWPGCGRASQYDLWHEESVRSGFFVRPARSGAPECLGAGELLNTWTGRDAAGREVGTWQVFAVDP